MTPAYLATYAYANVKERLILYIAPPFLDFCRAYENQNIN